MLLSVVAGLPLAAWAAGPDDEIKIPPLRPAHPIIPVTFWERYGWLIILLGFLLTVVTVLIVWIKLLPKPPVVVPPEVEARLALAAVPADVGEGAILSRVSQILRGYLRRAFRLPPGETTTTAFCGMLLQHPRIGPGLAASLVAFFQDNDRRKFAPAGPSQASVNAVAQALALIDQCEARRASLIAAATASATPHPKPA
jgi:hypothetical protein